MRPVPFKRLKVLLKTEKGSAFVLTLLFILLLTTMSTGMYLFSTKQSIFADTEYTSLAADCIAQAGIERAKSVLASQDETVLDTNNNGEVDPSDFPVIFRKNDFGQVINSSDARTGEGSYSVRIDRYAADFVEMQFNLDRTMKADGNCVNCTAITQLNKLLSFKELKVAFNQNNSSINEYSLTYLKDIIPDQIPGTLRWEFAMDNIVNPYAERLYTLEMNVSRLDLSRDGGGSDFDHNGNPIVIFPNNNGYNATSAQYSFPSDKTGGNALVFNYTPKTGAHYIVHIHREDLSKSPELTLIYYDSISGTNLQQQWIKASNWSANQKDIYYFLNFESASLDSFATPDDPAYSTINNITPQQTGQGARILHLTGVAGSYANAEVRISRGVHDRLDLEYRSRTQKMIEDTCGGNPSSSSCRWFPDWPVNNSEKYRHLITLTPDNTPTGIHGSVDIKGHLQVLDREKTIRVDELYQVSSAGSIKRTSRTHAIFCSPVGYLDFAFFVGNRWNLAEGASVAGKVYTRGRLELPNVGTVSFYDDVYTSRMVVNPGTATFYFGGLHTNLPFKNLPDRTIFNEMRVLANAGGWFISGDAALCLGNYNYTDNSPNFYGFNFYDPNPSDNSPVAIYKFPPVIQNDSDRSHDPRTVAVLPGASPPDRDLTFGHYDPLGNPYFNGVVFVDGDLHIWGKLHGHSLTIVAHNIYIDREIIMGTDIVDSTGYSIDGYPVHLGLIAGRPTVNDVRGDIYLSQYCPRNMRIEAALMAPGPYSSYTVEDIDVSSGPGPGNLDSDRSHPIFHVTIDSNGAEQFNILYPYNTFDIDLDLNGDGRKELDMNGWNETSITQNNHLWYLVTKGPIVIGRSGTLSFYALRNQNSPIDYNASPDVSTAREFFYDPAIKFNQPPLFPKPDEAIEVQQWTNTLAALPD